MEARNVGERPPAQSPRRCLPDPTLVSQGPRAVLHGVDDLLRLDVIQVPTRGRDVGMPQLLRDDPDVYALGPQLRRACVAEAVGVDALLDPGPPGHPLEHGPDVGPTDGSAVERAEQRLGARAVDATVPPHVQPCHTYSGNQAYIGQ